MWYWIFRTLSFIILKLFFCLKAEGLKNLPKKNNFIIVANHASFIDPLVIAAVIPHKIYCVSIRALYRIRWLNWALNKLESFPTGGSSAKAIQYLSQNKIVGLFPEGGCTRDGRLREFKKGAALIAVKTGRPIVPCAILGTYQALPARAKFPRFAAVKLKIGKPIYLLKEFDDLIDEVMLQEGTFRIKNKIKEMLDAG